MGVASVKHWPVDLWTRALGVLGVGGRLGVRLRAWMTCRMGASSMQVKVYFRRQTHGTSGQERAPLGAERPLQTF